MTASRLPLVIEALTGVIETALATAGTNEHNQPAPIEVLVGPHRDEDFPQESVVIGDNADEDEDIIAATSDRTWTGLGAQRQDESGEVTCTVVVWSGDEKFRPLITRAYAIFDLVETALREDPTVAGGTGTPGWGLATEAPLRLILTNRGAEVRITFVVAYRSRI